MKGCRLPSESASSSGYPLTLFDPDAGDLLPSLLGHYPVSTLIRSSPPLGGASVLSASWFVHLCLSLSIASQVLKFRTKARTRFTPPLHRTPHSQ